ncbi:hypothetical protein HUU39_18815 [candidate division KSB1 bacterium]|nr:hypothetical protein [candidate division KSB1 bacterium]
MRKASAGRATSSLHDPTVPEPKQAEALAKASKGAKENVTSETTAHAKTQRYAKKILTSDFHEENK